MLARTKAKAIFIEQIKAKQFGDKKLKELKEKMANGKVQETNIDVYGAIIVKGSICGPRVDGLITIIAGRHGS